MTKVMTGRERVKNNVSWFVIEWVLHFTVLPAKSESDFMICLQIYQGLIIDRPLVY